MTAVCQIVKLPGCVYQRLCLKLRKMPRMSQKTKLLELLTGSILSDIFKSITFCREQRHLWFSAIKQNFQQSRGCWIAEISDSWLCMEQLI